MVHDSVLDCVGATPLVRLRRLFGGGDPQVLAKLELLNPGGSVKDRPARFFVEAGLRDGTLRPGTRLVESSSGNLGIALAMAARVHDLAFTCVVDPHITPTNLRILEALGAEVDMVRDRDEQGSYLRTRIRRVRELVASVPGALWVNQYANARNWQAHYHLTAREVLAQLDGPVDHLVVPVSTTGTILGLARRLRLAFPGLRVIAVDAVGSVIFGGHPGRRLLPGHGAGRVPELLRPEEIDAVVQVTDREAVRGCRRLVEREGILAGGSSGAVVTALVRLRDQLPARSRVLVVLPDRGDRYLDIVYDGSLDGSVEGSVEDVTDARAGQVRELAVSTPGAQPSS